MLNTNMKGKSKEQNLEIECYRILATVAVAVLHFSEDYTGDHGIIHGGFLGVEFFFMLSGYFLMLHWLRQENGGLSSQNAAEYLGHRLKRLYPPFLVATIMMQLVQWAFGGFGIKKLIIGFWNIRWQFLMCQHLGAPTEFNMRSVWYLSSLILLIWLIYFLIDYNLDIFLGITPVIDVLLFVYMYRTFGTLNITNSYNLIFDGGLLRGFASMTLGSVVAYTVCETKKKIMEQWRWSAIALIVARICCWSLIGFVMIFRGFDEKDFVVIPAMLLLLAVAGIKPILSSGGYLSRCVLYLGGISYWAYLLHLIVSYCLVRLLPGRNYPIMLILFGILIIGASSMMAHLSRLISGKK